ncbi:glycoside hydrolase family 18 protein [Aquicella lusitana]|uniref:chitinase n=1 Tax=Aquicella lusitana TaxID=254246 RepID=A0A370GYH3_9COXI|nr:glycoside hydrolase family 18 protein [Aquicella lusitana]RDI48692.1 GH18 family chitinase [Aquicella lusitana]VVC73931.1 hypothetical protein AQULUS_16920 [Aquicella lusitana]
MKKLHKLLLSALTWTIVTSAGAAPFSPGSKPIVAQFFGIWTERGQVWEQKFRTDTPFDKLNRLYIAFGKIIKTPEGHFSIAFDGQVEHVQDIIARMKSVNPDAELFLAVGGDGDKNSYGGAANDPQFAENVRQFLGRYGFNGFDIDWEMRLNKQDLNNLVKQLYPTLHSYGYRLTLDVWPYVSFAYDMSVLKDNLDQINIMSYGTGLHLASITAQYEKAGFPRSKIIGGIETERGYNQFGGVTDTLGPNGTIAEKSRFALTEGLAGMMEWRLDNDYTTTANPNYPTYQGAQALWQYMTNLAD